MNATPVESKAAQTAAYGGLIDALGGIATAVLAIIGLTGFDPAGMAGIATVVFGAALLIQGGTIVSEYTSMISAGSSMPPEAAGGEGLSAVLVVGATGIVLGVLALLGIAPETLTAAAAIAFGSALVLSSGTVRQLYLLQTQVLQLAAPRSTNELLAGQMAAGSAGVLFLAGIAATVLGILAAAGQNPVTLTLSALLLVGLTVLLTGSTLSGLVLSFMRPAHPERRRFSPGPGPM